ncbi:hypothetical protein L9F63_018758, partial [Diploptera punctata]
KWLRDVYILECRLCLREVFEEVECSGNNDGLVSDAHGLPEIGSLNHMGAVSPQLTRDEVIKHLEDLEYYEKVSLAFLVCDEINYILQQLLTAERARCLGSVTPVPILSEWLRCQRHGSWENKIVEALSIIQNYQVLEQLGYDAESVKTRFLPRSPETSLFVNCMRKAIYHMCESLDKKKLVELTRRVKNDYDKLYKGEALEVYDEEFMEINILNWSIKGYINLGDRNGRGVDIHKLKTVLKGMDELTVLDNLESSEKATVNASVGYRDLETSSTVSETSMSSRSSIMGSLSTRSERSLVSQHSVASAASQVRKPQHWREYDVDPHYVGCCLIINQKNFYQDQNLQYKHVLPDEELETRLGTDMDRERLIETFESMGFDTITKEDLTHSEMLDSVNEVLRDDFKQEHSCFVLCIMSHGVKGEVYGSNSVPVSEEDLKEVIRNNRKLRGKPKILIIQACQGKAHQDVLSHDDISSDGPEIRGVSADFITFWSTVPGYASFRHEIQGTWFIQALCRIFLGERFTDNVVTLFTQVNGDVSCQRTVIRGACKTMVSQFQSTLVGELNLPLRSEKQLDVSLRMFQRHMFIALLWQYIESRKIAAEKRRKLKLEQLLDNLM